MDFCQTRTHELCFLVDRIKEYENQTTYWQSKAEICEIGLEDYLKTWRDLEHTHTTPTPEGHLKLISKTKCQIRKDLRDILDLIEEHNDNPDQPFFVEEHELLWSTYEYPDEETERPNEEGETENTENNSVSDESIDEDSASDGASDEEDASEKNTKLIESKWIQDLGDSLRRGPKDARTPSGYYQNTAITENFVQIALAYKVGADLLEKKRDMRINAAQRCENHIRSRYQERSSLMMNTYH